MKEFLKRIYKYIFYGIPCKKTVVNILSVSRNELLKNRCALITGGTSGIGYAIAEEFLNVKCSVIITGRNKEKLDIACKELREKYGNDSVFGIILDNSNIRVFDKVFAEILSEVNKSGIHQIDILVNNAGVNSVGMPFALEEDFDNVLDTNLKGTYFLSQMFCTYLKNNKIVGNILNISSASSLRPANSPYILSKWGIRALTLGLAKSFGKYNITVNGIAPGPTATPMIVKGHIDDYTLDRIPLGRYIFPKEIANMAVFLVSDNGRAILGDTIFMTGGAGLLTYDDIQY